MDYKSIKCMVHNPSGPTVTNTLHIIVSIINTLRYTMQESSQCSSDRFSLHFIQLDPDCYLFVKLVLFSIHQIWNPGRIDCN